MRGNSGSTERSPSTPLTTIGKKQISATMTSFGLDVVAQQDHQDRGQHHHRHGLRGDQQRVDGAAQDPREVQDDGQQEAGAPRRSGSRG